MSKFIDKQIVRETAKAVLVDCLTLKGQRQIWFPLSQVTITDKFIELTDWIARVKQEEFGYICPIPACELAA